MRESSEILTPVSEALLKMVPRAALLVLLAFACSAVNFHCQQKTDGFYPSPDSCSAFYRCVDGVSYTFQCPSGLVFNPDVNVCDWPYDDNCQLGPQPTVQVHTAQAPLSGASGSAAFHCQQKDDGFYPSPDSCSAFYRCVDGVTYTFQCPSGLVFNPDVNVCDWPYNYNCQLGPQPTVQVHTAQAPSSGTSGSGCARRVCYYTNWSQYRPGGAQFLPEDIDPFLCSHVIFAFSKLEGNHLAPVEWNDENTGWSAGMYKRINDLKSQNPSLKTLLAVGGWNMGSLPFSNMVATQTSRQDFVDHSVTYLRERGFDGLDLDWEYPAARGSPPEDKTRFAQLVQQLRDTYNADAAVNGHATPLLLSAAVPAVKSLIDAGYDIPSISQNLDFINLMSYDLHGAWDTVTGHNSPLFPDASEIGDNRLLNVDFAARYMVEKGCPPEKLVIGLPTYGRTFTLSNASNTALGAPAAGAGTAGQFTGEAGVLAYYEICTKSSAANLVSRITDSKVPYLVYNNDQWVGYDDAQSLRDKVRYVKVNGYGGVMTWTIDLDDFSGTFCGQGTYPLWSAVNDECAQ